MRHAKALRTRERHRGRSANERTGLHDKVSLFDFSKNGSSVTHPFIVAFVVFHLVAIPLFATPTDLFLLNPLKGLIAPYMRCVGLNEIWDMFAPNPKSSEQYLKAMVMTTEGDTQIYSFPRMEELPLPARYQKERYRKFIESILCKDCAGLWPDIEKGVARRMMNPTDPPIKVILIKFESPIDPTTGLTGEDIRANPTVLSEQYIEAKDLR